MGDLYFVVSLIVAVIVSLLFVARDHRQREVALARIRPVWDRLEAACESNVDFGKVLCVDGGRYGGRYELEVRLVPTYQCRAVAIAFYKESPRRWVRIFRVELDPFADEAEALAVSRPDGTGKLYPLSAIDDVARSLCEELRSYRPPGSELRPAAA